jgi:hypothetical protein
MRKKRKEKSEEIKCKRAVVICAPAASQFSHTALIASATTAIVHQPQV